MKPVFDEMAGYSAGRYALFYYDAETSEYTGWSDEYINTGVSMPPVPLVLTLAKTFREEWQYLQVRMEP